MLETLQFSLPVLAAFIVIALAAKELGKYGSLIGMPFISGLILTGLLVGPDVLGFVSETDSILLRFIDLLALPFIAFAAGAEIHLGELQKRFSSILKILFSIIFVVLITSAAAFFFLSDFIPFLTSRPDAHILGIAILGGCVMVAKSPSSLVAIIKELRGQGPFIQTALGVTVIMDAIVILLFAIAISLADMLFSGASFDLAHISLILVEIAVSLVTGLIIGGLLTTIFAFKAASAFKGLLVLALGYLVSSASMTLSDFHLPIIPIKLFSEPLLICMVAGFFVTNKTKYSAELAATLEKLAIPVFVLFFTGLGISLDLDVLKTTWHIAGLIALIRLVGMQIGCIFGGAIAGVPKLHRKVLGLTFITQAGISISLAKEIGLRYSGWGNEFTTLLVSVIVINTLIGPGLTKFAIQLVGEAHTKAKGWRRKHRSAFIFGVENHSIALAKTLQDHDWSVVLADTDKTKAEQIESNDVAFCHLKGFSVEALKEIGADSADTLVAMMDEDTNFTICDIAYDHFGTDHLVARCHEGFDHSRFYQIGVMVIEPSSAMLNLLDHCIRSPSAASLVLGQEQGSDVIEIEIGNPEMAGLYVRHLSLPSDIIILSIRRGKNLILTHGYTRLKLGDEITLVGSEESLNQVSDRFEAFEKVTTTA